MPQSSGVHWTVYLCLYRFYMPQSSWSPLDSTGLCVMPLNRFYIAPVWWSPVESTGLCTYAFIDFTCSSPVGVQWSPLDCVLMPLYRLYMPQSSGLHQTPLDCVLCLSIDFTCPSLVESSGVHWTLSKKKSSFQS